MTDVHSLLTQADEAIAAAQTAIDPAIEAAHDDLATARLLIATALMQVGKKARRD